MSIANVWSAHVDLGTIFVLLLVSGVAGYFAVRGKQAASAEKRATSAEQSMRDFRENYLAEHERVESLQAQLLEQRELKHEALSEIAALRMATDLTAVMREIADVARDLADFRAEMAEHFDQFSAALETFSKTQEAQTSVLQAIEKRLSGRTT